MENVVSMVFPLLRIYAPTVLLLLRVDSLSWKRVQIDVT
jgi:hypothetical protein